MNNKIDETTSRFALFADGKIEDLYDVRIWHDSVTKTAEERSAIHGKVLRASSKPTDMFNKIVGVSKEGVFVPVAPSNWDKLFWIRHQFEYYLGYSIVGNMNDNFLSGRSTDGIMWNFNIIDC